MPITIDLPDDCAGNIVFMVDTMPRDRPNGIPGWVMHGDAEFPAAALALGFLGDVSVMRRLYWRRIPQAAQP